MTRRREYDPDPRDPRYAAADEPDERYLDERDVRARYLDRQGGYDERAPAYDESAPGYDDRAARYDDRPAGRRSRRREAEIEPAGNPALRIVLVIAAIGAIVFLVFAVLARDIPMLASAALVFGVVFVVVALTAGRATWRAAADGRNGQAFGLAVGGGVAAMVGLGALALAIVLVLIWSRG